MSQQLFATFYPKTQKLDEPLPRSQRFNQTAEIRRKQHSQMKQNHSNTVRSNHSRNSYKIENNSTDTHDGEIDEYQSCHTFEDDMIMRYERASSRNGKIDNPYAALKLKQLGLSSFEGAYQGNKPLRRLDRSCDDGINQANIFSKQGVFKGNSYSLKLERSVDDDDGDDNNSDKSYVSNVVKRQKAQESQMQILSMQTQYKQQQSQESGEFSGIAYKRQQQNHHHEYPFLITKLILPNQPSAQEALQLCKHGMIQHIIEDNTQPIASQEDKPTEESSLFVSINRHFLKKVAGNTNKSGVILQDNHNNSTTVAGNNTTDKPKKTSSIDRIAGIRMRALSQNCKRLESTVVAPSSNPRTHKFTPFTYHSQNFDKLTSFIEGTTPNSQPQLVRELPRQGNTSPMMAKHTAASIERQSPKRTYLLLGRTREEQFKQQIGCPNGRLKSNALGSGSSMRTEGAKQQLNLLERLQNYSSKARRNNLNNSFYKNNNNNIGDTYTNDNSSDTKQFRKWHLPKQQRYLPAPSQTMHSQQNELTTGQLADQRV